MSTTPPGWYPDPSGQHGTRWWDGVQWTDQVGPPTSQVPRPRVPDHVPTDTAWVWIMALLPIVSLPVSLLYQPEFRYEVLPVRIDEALLKEIADVTGGRYFRAKDADALGQIFSQIDRLEKTPIQVTRYVRYDELTRPFVVAGLIALGLELLLAGTIAVRVP